MNTTETVLLVVAVLAVLTVVVLLVARERRRAHLKARFGPEYDRTVQETDRRAAERELAQRAERRDQLDIRPLPPEDQQRFQERWRETQEEFVDRPSIAVQQADLLIAEVMSRRGYPVGDVEQQVRDVSVDHADVVEEYRQAHEISLLNDRNEATTEDLRQAMVHYRALFAALIADGETDRTIDLRDQTARAPRRGAARKG